MTSVADLLREADPIGHEPEPTVEERERLRRTIAACAARPRTRGRRARPRTLASATALVVVALIVASYQTLSRSGAAVQAAIGFEVRLAETEPGPGLRPAQVGSSDRVVYLHDAIIVSNGDLVASRVAATGDRSRYDVHVRLSAAAAGRLRQATLGHIGRPVAILIDGQVVTAPIVRSAIGDSAVIGGRYTEQEAQAIANGIRAR